MNDTWRVSTGDLPEPGEIRRLMDDAHDRFRSIDDGAVADYIPALASADPTLFGAAITGVSAQSYSVGDAGHRFSIQSVSKPFVYALVCEAIGHDAARERLGVNATGLPFNSVMAVEMNEQRTMNPMVNAGAIATTSLIPGDTVEAKWAHLHEGLSRFAGRELEVDEDVYRSEAATNDRNEGIAHLLDSYGRVVLRPGRRDRHLHAAVLPARERRGSVGDGRDPGRRRGEPDHRRAA